MNFGILDIENINDDTGDDALLLCSFVAPIRVISKTSVRGSDTLNLKRSRYRTSAQRWEIETDTAIMDGNPDLFAHQIEKDSIDAFYVRTPLPVKKGTVTQGMSRGAVGDSVAYPLASATELVNSSGTGDVVSGHAGAESVLGISLDASSSIFKTDFIRFNGHDKVYMVTKVDSIVPASHTANITIFPALIESVLPAETIYLGTRATMKVTYDFNSILGVSYVDGILADPGRLTLIEDL